MIHVYSVYFAMNKSGVFSGKGIHNILGSNLASSIQQGNGRILFRVGHDHVLQIFFTFIIHHQFDTA
jgi:hypothetical protein